MNAQHNYIRTNGGDLRVNDTIQTWWGGGRDTIVGFEPYTGQLECMRGARIAMFALLKTGMTIEPGSTHMVLCQPGY